jgi:hypothetical protein
VKDAVVGATRLVNSVKMSPRQEVPHSKIESTCAIYM